MLKAGYVVFGGLAGAALSFGKMMTPSEVSVLLSSIPIGILGGIVAMRRMMEYTDARAKKKTIKQGNSFTMRKSSAAK